MRALAGEETSITGARCLAELVARAGQRVATSLPGLTHLFPTPAEAANANLEALGITGARAQALRVLARAVADRRVDFESTTEKICARLAAISGVGQGTAQYVALRALGEPDAFPASDARLRRMAAQGGSPFSAYKLQARAEAWRPWRGYAAMHFWCAAAQESHKKRGSSNVGEGRAH